MEPIATAAGGAGDADAARVNAGGPRLLRVGGIAPGAGASSVALALAGLCAWAGRRVVVLGGADLLRLAGCRRWTGPGGVELARLSPEDAARELPAVARPLRGLGHLSLLAHAGPAPCAAGWPVDAVVVDVGLARDTDSADLFVSRPDRTLQALAATAAPVVLNGEGDAAGMARLAARVVGAPPVACLPWSARVARAAVAGRVPLSLPGSYLQRLRPLARAVTA